MKKIIFTLLAGFISLTTTTWANDLNPTDPVQVSQCSSLDSSILGRYYVGSVEMAYNDNDNAIAVWTQKDTSNISQIFVSVLQSGTWSVPVIISSGSYSASSQKVVMNNNDVAIVTWIQKDDAGISRTNARVYSSGSWGSINQLDDGTTDTTTARISLNNLDTAIVVWKQGSSTSTYAIFSSVYSSGAWSTATQIDGGTYNATLPSVSLGDDGNGFAFWSQSDSTGYARTYALSYTSSGWGSSVTVDNGSNPNSPDALHGKYSNGYAVVVWEAKSTVSSVASVYASTYSEMGGWETQTTLGGDSSSLGKTESPQVVINSSGLAIATWEQNQTSGSTSNIIASVFDGGTWTKSTLTSSTVTVRSGPKVTLNESGKALVAWQDSVKNSGSFYTSGSWAASSSLHSVSSTTLNSYRDIEIALNSDGKALLVFIDDNSDKDYEAVYSSSYDTSWSTKTKVSSLLPYVSIIEYSLIELDEESALINWHEYSDANYSSYGSSFNLVNWSDSEKFGTVTYYANSSLAPFGGSNKALTVWNSNEDIIYGSYYDSSSGYTPASFEIEGHSAQVYENKDGVVLNWYTDSSDDYEDIFATVITSSGTEDPFQLNNPSTYSYYIVGTTFDDDKFALVWTEGSADGYETIHISIHDDSGWSTPIQISDSDTYDYSYLPKIASYGDDGFVVIWYNYYLSSEILISQTYTTSSGWEDPARVLISNFSNISLSSYQDGRVLMTWEDYLEGNLMYSFFDSSWSTPSLIATSGYDFGITSLVTTDDGAVILWNDYNDDKVYASKFNSTSWSTPVEVGSGFYPKIAHKNGTTVAVWTNENVDCGYNQIYSSVLETNSTSGGSGSGSGTSGSGGTSGSSTTSGGTTGGEGSESADSSGGGGCSLHIQ